MADEEKKSENSSADALAGTAASSDQSAAGAGNLADAAGAHADDSGSIHQAHDDHAHGHDDHAHAAPGDDFGEVIPEANWQDSFLSGVAVLVLCGFLWLGFAWAHVQPPSEGAHEESAAHAGEAPPPPLKEPLAPPPIETENPRTTTEHK